MLAADKDERTQLQQPPVQQRLDFEVPYDPDTISTRISTSYCTKRPAKEGKLTISPFGRQRAKEGKSTVFYIRHGDTL